MPSWYRASILKIVAVGLVVLAAGGCANGEVAKNHQQWVKDANNKWLTMRSGLILQMAQRQFDTGDLDQADKSLSEAMALDPENARLFVLAGRVCLERGQLERGYLLLEKAIGFDSKLPEAHYYQGLVLQRWQRYPAALEQYHQAYVLSPDNVAFLLAEAEMDVTIDQPETALRILSEKLTYFDQCSGLRVAVGHLHLMAKRYDKAAEYFRQALLLRPDDAQIAEDLALAQVAAGQTTAGIETLRKLLAVPATAGRRDLQRTLGAALVEAGQLIEAHELYMKLTQTDPSDGAAWLQLSEVCWTQEDTAGALLAATRTIALLPREPSAYLVAGLVYQQRGQLDEALTNFDRAAALSPQSARPVILRGLTLERAGLTADAAKAYAEALRRQPEDPRAKQLLARMADKP
jgi:tetratricopeptide (TPR) repeat protein